MNSILLGSAGVFVDWKSLNGVPGGMCSQSQPVRFSLLSKITNMSKLFSPEVKCWVLARLWKSPMKAEK